MMEIQLKENYIQCRACLNDCFESFYISTDIGYEEKTYQDLLEGLTGFTVEPDEPLQFCSQCATMLVESYKFKEVLEETQLILDRMKTLRDGDEAQIVSTDQEVLKVKEVKVEAGNIAHNTIVFEMEEIEGLYSKETETTRMDDLIEEIIEEDEEVQLINNTSMQVYDLDKCIIEIKQRNIICPYCPKQFEKERGLVDHLNRYHKDCKSYECRFCLRKFFTTQFRDQHTIKCPVISKPKTDQNVVCPECGKTGERRAIRIHIMNVHRKKNDGPYQCDLCKLWLKSKECLANHMKAKHLHRKFKCRFCEKYYSSRSGHDQHVQQHHKKEQTLNCDICSYVTHSKTLLRKHEMRHKITATYSCQICGSSFVSFDNLRRHQYVHTDERPWQCEVCNRSFKCKEALRKHSAIHQEYRYECPVCGKRYLTNQAMRNHCTKNHPDYQLPPLGTLMAADTSNRLFPTVNTKLHKTVMLSMDNQQQGTDEFKGDMFLP